MNNWPGPGGLRRPLRGAEKEKRQSTQRQSDKASLTQANRPPRFPVWFTSRPVNPRVVARFSRDPI